MPIWQPDLNSVKPIRASGFDIMGNVVDRSSDARFSLDADRWVLVYVKARFGDAYNASAASGSATLQCRLDHRKRPDDSKRGGVLNPLQQGTEMPAYSFMVAEWSNAGDGNNQDILYRPEPIDYPAFMFWRGDELVFTWESPNRSVQATATLTAAGIADTNTVVLGGRTYTYDVGPDAIDDVDVGGSVSVSLDNLIAAINGTSPTGQTTYFAGGTPNQHVTAVAGAGDTMVVTARHGGTGGNAITCTETVTGDWDNAVLSGGTDVQTQRWDLEVGLAPVPSGATNA